MHSRMLASSAGRTFTQDAKCWPALHPYGTGSLGSEPNSGGKNAIPRLCRNRLLLIQPSFRNNAAWAFWNMQRSITGQLFGAEYFRKKQGRGPSSVAADDNFSKAFGTVMPGTGLIRKDLLLTRVRECLAFRCVVRAS